MGIITLIWVVWGFSLCFGASGWFYGDPGDFVMLNRVSGAPLPHEGRGKMFVRDRVDALLDPGSPFLELSQVPSLPFHRATLHVSAPRGC